MANTDFSSTFGYDELVISRTDERGVILSANSVFDRLSEYEPSELKGAPHKILRHPDMPKALFHLVWDQLKKGKPIGAFIKNRTKTGRHYWVFAVIGPFGSGFLSVRFRPSDAGLALIAPIYRKIIALEEDETVKPEQSCAHFLKLLQAQGYPDYETFMSEMLADQLNHRSKMNKASPSLNAATFDNVFEQWNSIHESCNKISTAYGKIRLIPLNMQVQAAHLTEKGMALSVISSNFASLAQTINKGLEDFSQSAEIVSRTLYNSKFLSCTEILLREAEQAISLECGQGSIGQDEPELMSELSKTYRDKAVEERVEVSDSLEQFVNMTAHIKRELSALSVTQVMCSIENAQIHGTLGASIASIIEELRNFQNLSDGQILSIGSHLNKVRHQLTRFAS